jgi:hypothetical protein
MGKLIYVANLTLDGYIEDESGTFDLFAPNDDVFAAATDVIRSAGTFLYGRRLYETMAVWETEPDWLHSRRPTPNSPTPGRRRARSCTRRPWRGCRPRTPGSSAASIPPLYAG